MLRAPSSILRYSLLSVGLLACSSEGAAPTQSTGGAPSAGGAPTAGAGSSAGGGASGSNNASGTGGVSGSPDAGGSPSGGAAGTSVVAGATNGGGGTTNGGGGTTTDAPCVSQLGVTFCEDFEAHAPGTAQAVGPWSPAVNGDGATVEIDATTARSGKSSLKVRAGGFNAFYSLSVATALTKVPSALHLRAYVRITEPMAGGHNTYVVADTVAAPGQGNAFKIGEMNEMLMYNVGGDAHAALANDDFYTDHLLGAAFKAGEWGCLELTLDHAKPEIVVSLDGAAIPDMHHTDFPLDAYDSVRFGFEKYAGPMRDIWYDDIAISTAPLGCK